MKEKKILPLVISMTLPMVISMAVNSMYNIVDSYFVAMMSEDAMTALALVYPVQNLIKELPTAAQKIHQVTGTAPMTSQWYPGKTVPAHAVRLLNCSALKRK